jgi:hypothetical protein
VGEREPHQLGSIDADAQVAAEIVDRLLLLGRQAARGRRTAEQAAKPAQEPLLFRRLDTGDARLPRRPSRSIAAPSSTAAPVSSQFAMARNASVAL